jgi:RNA polymerase sigma-70 factor (sigma-E family)
MTAESEGCAVAADEASGGAADRIAVLYAEHAPGALRFAFLLTGEQDLAEDLIQEAFVRVIGRFGDLRSADAFPAYLRRTIVNLSYGTFRRRRVERAYLSRERRSVSASLGSPDDTVSEREELWSRVHRLPARQRAALVLRYYEDLSEKQTAAAMGCSLRTVKSLVNRGLANLRQEGERP